RRPSFSTLFPYTTLFRSLRMTDQVRDGMNLQPVSHIGAHAQGVGVVETQALAHANALFLQSLPDLMLLAHLESRNPRRQGARGADRKSTRLNSSHQIISY